MRVPPDPSGGDGGSLLASSPTGSLPAARFSRTVVSLNVVSLSRLHRVKVFKVLSDVGITLRLPDIGLPCLGNRWVAP